MEVVLGFAQVQGEGVVEEAQAGQGLVQAVDGAGGGLEVAVEVVGGGVVRGALGRQPPPLTTGWKVQKPPSAGVLRRERSMARAWACSRVSGVVSLVRSSPGWAVPGPVTHTCWRTLSRSDWVRWT
ncbi:hypothetical protein [Streptomyces sp. NBC_00448]|uniref:hypothetical protein n=1 Tax=Streptomyces sp. NBC_00448 TaxID=2903652 RepID=UPI002E2225B0